LSRLEALAARRDMPISIGMWSTQVHDMTRQFAKTCPHIAGSAGTGGNTHHEPSSCLKNMIVSGPVEVQPSICT
jgi:hypothetical protein